MYTYRTARALQEHRYLSQTHARRSTAESDRPTTRTGEPRIRTRLVPSGVAVCIVAAVIAGVTLNGCGIASSVENRGAAMAAWSLRLERQAEDYRAAREAQAWTARLNGLADEVGARAMSDRARQAWTLRLNGLGGGSVAAD